MHGSGVVSLNQLGIDDRLPALEMDALRQSAADVRQHVNALNPLGDAEMEVHGIVEALRRVALHAEHSLAAFAAIDGTLDLMKLALRTVAQTRAPKLSESRCIMSLRTLGSNKQDFKFWHERFVNART